MLAVLLAGELPDREPLEQAGDVPLRVGQGFRYLYFGSILPNSIAAKTGTYFVHPLQALATLLGFFATRSPLKVANWPMWVMGLSLTAVLASCFAGAAASIKIKQRALPVVIYSIAYWLALSIGNPLLFFWYYPPLIWALDTFTLLGVANLAARISVMVRDIVLSCVIVGLILIQWIGLGPFRLHWPVDLRQREFTYVAVAADLVNKIEPGRTVALPEIGVFGYVFDQAYIIDTVGLVSPQAIPHRLPTPAPDQTINYAISSEVIAELQPDNVVTLEIFARPTLLHSPKSFRSVMKKYAQSEPLHPGITDISLAHREEVLISTSRIVHAGEQVNPNPLYCRKPEFRGKSIFSKRDIRDRRCQHRINESREGACL